jgi:hypothetical protein
MPGVRALRQNSSGPHGGKERTKLEDSEKPDGWAGEGDSGVVEQTRIFFYIALFFCSFYRSRIRL